MDSSRKIALVTGVFFVVTFITSIPALPLYAPVLNNADYIVGVGADTRVLWGAFLEVILAIACIGTAVTLFPILKRQNEAVALGYVAARAVESTVIVVGIVSVLSVVTLRQELAGAAGADAASLVTVGNQHPGALDCGYHVISATSPLTRLITAAPYRAGAQRISINLLGPDHNLPRKFAGRDSLIKPY